MRKLEKLECLLLAAVAVLLAIGLFGPLFGLFVAQPEHQHDFADQRVWGAIPFAMDVLSNLPFALWGAVGLGCVAALFGQKGLPQRSMGGAQTTIELGMAALFFAGLLATAGASSWYHWLPNNSGLAIDRLGMTVAFAGLLGLAAAGQVSGRAGLGLGCAVLVLGALSVRVWLVDGTVLPWVLVQFGGMAVVLWLACLAPLPGALPVRWRLVIAFYAVAKLLELGDHLIYDLTANVVSGHTLKHAVASLTAWPVLAALGVWLKSSRGAASLRLQVHKIRAECPSQGQCGVPGQVPSQLHAPCGLYAVKTNQKRSQA